MYTGGSNFLILIYLSPSMLKNARTRIFLSIQLCSIYFSFVFSFFSLGYLGWATSSVLNVHSKRSHTTCSHAPTWLFTSPLTASNHLFFGISLAPSYIYVNLFPAATASAAYTWDGTIRQTFIYENSAFCFYEISGRTSTKRHHLVSRHFYRRITEEPNPFHTGNDHIWFTYVIYTYK